MRAGSLNKRVTIQDLVVGRDGNGGIVHTYSDVATVWAAIEPAGGKQAYAAAQVQPAADVVVRIRYRRGIRSTMRFAYVAETGSPSVVQYYAIVSEPGSILQRKREILCRCVLRESDGFRG